MVGDGYFFGEKEESQSAGSSTRVSVLGIAQALQGVLSRCLRKLNPKAYRPYRPAEHYGKISHGDSGSATPRKEYDFASQEVHFGGRPRVTRFSTKVETITLSMGRYKKSGVLGRPRGVFDNVSSSTTSATVATYLAPGPASFSVPTGKHTPPLKLSRLNTTGRHLYGALKKSPNPLYRQSHSGTHTNPIAQHKTALTM